MRNYSSSPAILKTVFYAAVLCLFAGLSAVKATVQEKATTPAAGTLPEAPGKAAVLKLCGTECHAAELVLGKERTEDEWEETIIKMTEFGAKGTDEEFYEVFDYLAKHFPKRRPGDKINVNTATAKILEDGLEIATKEAETIVAYREENGNFKSLEDLKKVPGVDTQKLELKKDRLVF